MLFNRIGILGLQIAIALFFCISSVAAEKLFRFAPPSMEGEKFLHPGPTRPLSVFSVSQLLEVTGRRLRGVLL
jgi:hypothetical protein